METIPAAATTGFPSSPGVPPFPADFNAPKRLMVTQQTCLVEEKFSKNGVQKNVHVVVKNNPFLLTLVLLDKGVSFHQLSTEVQLIYDCASQKEVDFVKLKPLEWKTRPNEEGDQLTVELRIKVLTSQLEDMFFRVKVKVVDPRTRKEFPHLTALSHPIRVVSKPDQVRKKIKKRKRAPTDSLMDTLHRLESQQREQQKMLKRLGMFTVRESPASSIPAFPLKDDDSSVPRESSNECSALLNNSSAPPKDEFQTAFTDFLASFKQLQTQDPQDGYKINTCANDAQTMAEILDIIRAEVSRRNRTTPKPAGHPHLDSPCSCEVCPYKERMDKINESYKAYLYSAVIPDLTGAPSFLPLSGEGTAALGASSLPTALPSTSPPVPPPPMILPSSSPLSSTSASSTGSSFVTEMSSDVDDLLLSADADASLSNFLNLSGFGFGFDGFAFNV